MSVPALRFPEFVGEWERKRLGDIATFQRGFDLPSQDREEGTVPIVSSGGVTGFHSEAKVERPGIVTGRYGSIGDLFYLKEPHWPLNTALWVKDFHGNSIDFAFYHLSRVDFAKLSDKTGVPGINRNDLHRLWASTTSFPEQKKIATFLGGVDAKIAALRARRAGLERYKRGLMQALFSQTLRFTKPDGSPFPDWEEKRLGEVATRSTAKNTKLEYMRVLTNSAVRGVVDQGDYFEKDIANAENLAGYYVLKKGDFVYNPRISVSAPVGPIKRNDLGDGVMSPLYTVFRFMQKDTAFYNLYFATTFWHKYMKSVANYGARHDRMAITSGDLMNMPLPHPHPDEQAKIAEALFAMDAKIAAVGDQVTQIEAFKKGLLQQMFV